MATEKGFQDLSKRKTARVLTELDLQIIMARIDELEASAVPRTQFAVTPIPGELDPTGLRIVFTEHSAAPQWKARFEPT